MKYIIVLLIVSYTLALSTQCNKLDPTAISDLLNKDSIIYSGYLNVIQDSESALAFIFYGQQGVTDVTKLKDHPTLIWLNGLITQSSQIGNFLEIGPLRLNKKGELEKNVNTWNKDFNLLFVDLVVGVGYSEHASNADIPQNSKQLVDQFLHAIEQFIKGTNGCVKSQGFTGLDVSDWYIFGEGYAAKQIVNIAAEALDKESSPLNKALKGIGLGNAHVDPLSLLTEIPSYASNMGLIEPRERQVLDKLALKGVKQIENKQYLAAHNTINQAINLLHQYSGGIDLLNIDHLTGNEAWFVTLYNYLDLLTTKASFKFQTDIAYKKQPAEIYAALTPDFPTVTTLPKLKTVQSKIKVLVYNGQNDVSCPIPSTLRYLSEIIDDFKTKSLSIQKVNDKIVGYYQQVGNLRYVSINNAGYYVPVDKGAEIQGIIEEWLK